VFQKGGHFGRDTDAHQYLTTLATDGQANSWDSLASLFASKIKELAQHFFHTHSPNDIPDDNFDQEAIEEIITRDLKTGWAAVIGSRSIVEFDASKFGLGVIRFGVVAKFVLRIVFETSEISSLSRLSEGQELPVLVGLDTGVVDVRTLRQGGQPFMKYLGSPRKERGTNKVLQQAIYEPIPAPPANYEGVVWVGATSTHKMNQKEFWEFLQDCNAAQQDDNAESGKLPPSTNRLATWFSSAEADELLNTIYADTEEHRDIRQRVYTTISSFS
jgi:hypothetical protein